MSLQGYPQVPVLPQLVLQPVATFVTVFSGSWVNFDPSGVTWSRARYYRSVDGVVRLGGLVASGAVGTIFTLPAGHAPIDVTSGQTILFVVASGTGAAQVTVYGGSGIVALNSYLTGGSNGYVSLDGISFQATKP